MMLIHLEILQEGYLKQLYHVFAYLNTYPNSEIVINPRDQVIDQAEFEHQDWTSRDFGHVSGKEDLPTNLLDSRGLGFVITSRVDASHTGYKVTRCS